MCSHTNGGKVFEYSDQDFCTETNSWEFPGPVTSTFDELLCSRWDQAATDGLFRYTMDDVISRIIPGKRRYLAQLNIKRGTERRRPQAVECVNQPFDGKLFNFTKIKEHEVLFQLENKKKSTHSSLLSEKASGRDLVIINVSPLEYGHALIVPEVDSCLPQAVSEKMISLGVETMLLSSHRGFRVGFNSLCAFASVNHQHLHSYYCDYEFYIEHVKVKDVCSGLYELVDAPTTGFALQLYGSSVERFVRNVYTVAAYCQSHNIAYNVSFTRGDRIGTGVPPGKTIRAIVFPRKSVFGEKDERCFNVAFCELSGHLPIKSEKTSMNLRRIVPEIYMYLAFPFMKDVEQYENLTEAEVDRVLSGARLDCDVFSEIRKDLIEEFGKNI